MDKGLSELLELIQGKGKEGFSTYPNNSDPLLVNAHNNCLELERKELIYRFHSSSVCVIWKPIEQKKPGPSEMKDAINET